MFTVAGFQPECAHPRHIRVINSGSTPRQYATACSR